MVIQMYLRSNTFTQCLVDTDKKLEELGLALINESVVDVVEASND